MGSKNPKSREVGIDDDTFLESARNLIAGTEDTLRLISLNGTDNPEFYKALEKRLNLRLEEDMAIKRKYEDKLSGRALQGRYLHR